MAAKIYYQEDCKSSSEGQKIAIIGYGSQGHAHALNLKESDVMLSSVCMREAVHGRKRKNRDLKYIQQQKQQRGRYHHDSDQ